MESHPFQRNEFIRVPGSWFVKFADWLYMEHKITASKVLHDEKQVILPINQSINQPTSLSICQSISQSVSQSANQLISRSINPSINQPVNQLLVCMWRHGGNVGGQEQKHFSPLGTKLYFDVNSGKKILLFWPSTWPPWHVVANQELITKR